MWRSFFIAVGVCICILGLQCLVIDNFVVTSRGPDGARAGSRELTPPDWAPWSLISAGAVTVLYSFTIPQKLGKK